MAYEELLKSISLNADSSLAGYTGVAGQPGSASPFGGNALFRFVKLVSANTVGRASANTDRVIGVCQNKPQQVGAPATVAIFGVSNVIAGAAITAGMPITSDASGRAVDGTGGGTIYGIAVEDAAAAGHLVPVLLKV